MMDSFRHYYEHIITLQDITSSWKSLIVENRLLPPVAAKVATDITINIQNKSAQTPAQQDTKSSEPTQLDVLIKALAPPLRQAIQARRQSYQATLTSEASSVASIPAKADRPKLK